MEKKVTSTDVAIHAGVSQSVVSRVFTPGASVSKDKAKKVRKAALELGYRPNVLARAMVSGKSRIIGVVVAYLDNQFYPSALEKMTNVLQSRGYHVMVFMASHANTNVDAFVQEILDYQIEGIVLASASLSSATARECQNAGVPVVLFNRAQDADGVTNVTSNNFGGAQEVARFLVAGKHERIGYIAGWEDASTQRDREAGFRDGLRTLGHPLFAHAVGDYKADSTILAARDMFDRPKDQRPDAVFVANDHMALIVMDVLRFELGLRIPQDVSVVGFDDVPVAAWGAYRLTTVRQRINRMVEETVSAILDHIHDPTAKQSQDVVIEAPLVIRSSARIPETWLQDTNPEHRVADNNPGLSDNRNLRRKL